MSMDNDQIDRESYSRWLAVESVMTPIDKVTEYKKYIIRSYLYTRSRLMVPGRTYEDNDHGPLSAGGNAHVDIIDFDNWMEKQTGEDSAQLRREALDWMRDSSLEQVAYWRGLRHRSTIKRRRDKIVKNIVSDATKTQREIQS